MPGVEEIGKLAWIDKIQEWGVNKGADFLVNLIAFLLILIIGFFVIKTLIKISRVLLERSKRVSETLTHFLLNVEHKILWIVLLMLALPRLGIEIAPLIAGLGVTGFIIGFAFQESLGNLAAGLMIVINGPYKIGDVVEISGFAGEVKEMNMMATALATPDNKRVMIPNSKIWGNPIINYSAYDTRRVDLTVGISYSSDIGKAIATISSVLKGEKLVLSDPAPTIEVVEMGDSAVKLAVRPWCKNGDYWPVHFAVTRSLKEALDQAGIEIPFPQMDVHHHGMKSY
jgi:small conductance mechanosensitive channel